MSTIKLFKFISFSGHWEYPLRFKSLHLSKISSLRSPNDRDEFRHEWISTSAFFKKYSKEMRKNYQLLFDGTRVLCLSKSFNKHCWNVFSKNEGIVLEFDYASNMCSRDVTFNHTVYGDREINVPKYIISNITNHRTLRLLEKKVAILPDQAREIGNCIAMRTAMENHILRELALKKPMSFVREDEYRFIHLVPGTPGGEVVLKMIDDKLPFTDLGLNLTKIHTSSLESVLNIFPELSSIIYKIDESQLTD